MSANGYVRRGEKEIGPISPSQLKQWLAVGKLRRDDSLRREDGGEWMPASRLIDRATKSTANEPSSESEPKPQPKPERRSISKAMSQSTARVDRFKATSADPRRKRRFWITVVASVVVVGLLAAYVLIFHILPPVFLDLAKDSVEWPEGAGHDETIVAGVKFHAYDRATSLDGVQIQRLDTYRLPETRDPIQPIAGSALFRVVAPSDHWVFAWSAYPVPGALQGLPGRNHGTILRGAPKTPPTSESDDSPDGAPSLVGKPVDPHDAVFIVQSMVPEVYIATVAHPCDETTRKRAREFLDGAIPRGRRSLHAQAILTMLRSLEEADHERHIDWVEGLLKASPEQLATEDVPTSLAGTKLPPFLTAPAHFVRTEAACTLFVISKFEKSGPLYEMLEDRRHRDILEEGLPAALDGRKPPTKLVHRILRQIRRRYAKSGLTSTDLPCARDTAEALASLDPELLRAMLIRQARQPISDHTFDPTVGWSAVADDLERDPKRAAKALPRIVALCRELPLDSPHRASMQQAVDDLNPKAGDKLRGSFRDRESRRLRLQHRARAIELVAAEYETDEERLEAHRHALLSLIRHSDPEGVGILIDKGVPVGGIPESLRENAPLQAALEGRELEIAALLIENGASIGVTIDRSGREVSPLDVALSHGDDKLIELLVTRDAKSIVLKGGKEAVLQSVAQEGNARLVKLLLRLGADVQKTPRLLITLTSEGVGVDTVRAALAKGADPNATERRGTKQTALHKAAFYADRPYVQALLNGGAKPNIRDAKKRTPLDLALDGEKGKANPAVAELLRKHGAKRGRDL